MSGRIIRAEKQSGIPHLPVVGKIRIGMKNERGLPTSLDYFRADDQKCKYAEIFRKGCGEKPHTIQIIFPVDDPAEVCNERYEYRDDKGALVAYGDGEKFYIWDGKQYSEYSVEKYPNLMAQICQKVPTKKGEKNWQIVLTMKFLIPAVNGIVGLWQFQTRGEASSVKNIRDSFDAVKAIRGTVTQTVFDLSVEFAKSYKPGVNSRYPVVSLVANDTRIEDIRRALKPKDNISLLLPEKKE